MKKIPILLRSIIETNTFRQSSITFVGTVFNGALGALFYILVARFLGPSSFGILIVAITTLTLVSDIGDLGTDTGLVRFVGRNLKKDEKKAWRFLKLGFEIKIIVGIAISILGFIFAPFIANSLLAKPELATSLRISFSGVIGIFLYSFVVRVLQAYQKFWHWSGIQIATNFVRLAIVIILYFLAKANFLNILLVYIAVPFIGFFAGLFLIPTNFLKVGGEKSVVKDFFHYNKWVASFIFIAAFSSRLDVYISTRLLPLVQVGIYGVANQLIAIVAQISSAISTVIAPKMAAMGSKKNLIRYLKKNLLLVLGLSFLGILAIPIVLYLIPLLFGKSYIDSGPVFVILFFSSLVYLISVPIHMSVFYYFSYPKLFLYISIGHLAIISGLGYLLISNYGIIGSAFAVLAGSVFNFLVPCVWVISKVKKEE